MSSQLSFWSSRNFISYCLLPLSFCYRLIIATRRFLYKKNIKKTTQFNVPVIIVGNITTGGTGKTPLVIWLVKFLQQHGYRPGIVSRGYGGKADHYPQFVQPNSDPKKVGDEAVLLTRHAQCPMVVDPVRVNAVKKLLAETDCNIVISDDGLQHYGLGRDVEIVVIDGARRFSNNFCLPAGPLREPTKRLAEVDFIVVNGNGAKSGEYTMNLIPGDFCQITNPQITREVEGFKNKTIHGVAGIGNPARFFQTLHDLGVNVISHPFPDHYPFKPQDFAFVKADELVIMTEKDAVKCEAFADQRFWYLPVQTQLTPEFGDKLLNKIYAK